MNLLKHTGLLLLCACALVGCDYDSFEDEEGLRLLENANAFIRLTTSIEDNALEAEVSEDNTSTDVTLVNPGSGGSDITVMYALGGTATYGEIYTIDGASASGGSITLPFDNGTTSTAFSEVDITINYLVDTLMTAPLTIDLMLTGATAADGTAIEVGQGGLYKDVTITLVND